jgi:UDP-glucuronate 4-epimerase
MGVRALVTGCAGFIGSHLTESLLEDRHEVIGVDCFNDNYGRRQKLRNLGTAQQWDAFDFVPIDLSRGDLRDIVEDCDVVFHLAAEPGVRASWGAGFERYVRNNVLATQHLLEAARNRPNIRFVYASSSSIYGQASELPTREDTIPAPFSPYGMTKLSGEHLCGLYHGNFGVDAVMLRYFSVYGPRQRPDMAFRIFCEAVVAGQAIEVFGDGRQTRDFTFVDDVVRATRAAGVAADTGGRAFNVGGGSRASVNDALQLLEEFSGRRLEIATRRGQYGDVRDTGADISAAEEWLGYLPSVSFSEGLRSEWEWALANTSSPAGQS